MKKISYDDKVHRLGRISTVLFVLTTFLLPGILYFKWGILPTKEGFMAGIAIIATIMIPLNIAEFFSYAPVVGSAGYFVMLLSGNWMNIKIPASIVALDSVGLDANSEEGDVVSTMAISVSAIVSEIVIVLGVILLSPFTSFFAQPVIKSGFEQIVPALFGALFITYVLKNWKMTVVPAVVGFIVIKLGIVNALYNIPVVILISVIVTLILEKMGVYNNKDKSATEAA